MQRAAKNQHLPSADASLSRTFDIVDEPFDF